MKWISVFLSMLFFTSSVFAANFTPTVLNISGPSHVKYSFDGSAISIPVNVSGTPASASFLVFTNDKGTSIGKVRNGYLGWHYIDSIDTCVYTSPFTQLNTGANTVEWNGRDDDGNQVRAGNYTYYIWGFDNINPRVQMTKAITFSPWNHRTIITHDTQGQALTQPIWYIGSNNKNAQAEPVNHTLFKWIIGNDPENQALLETTIIQGYSSAGGIAFQPNDHDYFLYNTIRQNIDDCTSITQKWKWIPNGISMSQTEWGIGGQFSFNTSEQWGFNFGPGVVSDGNDYLFMVNSDITGVGDESELIYVDAVSGTEIKRLDLSEWWVSQDDAEAGGQLCGGPTIVSMRNGLMFLGSHSSCVNQMIDPYYEEPSDAVKWTNANGDYTGDHNFEPNSSRPWVCNDYNVGPYKYSFSVDANYFSIFPCFDLGAVSFGLYAPDGTGMGYLALNGETAAQKYGTEIIDYDSSYDGIYTSNNSGGKGDPTIWYVAQGSFKGMISPDFPLEDSIEITSPNGGERWAAGTTVNILWYSFRESTVNIEYSIDNGLTWKSIASGVASSLEKYPWIIPSAASTHCLVRITDSGNPTITDKSNAVFTITAPANSKTVSEAADAGWIDRYAYVFNGEDYVILDPTDPNDDTTIPAWGGFWVGVHQTVDLLFPKVTPEPIFTITPNLDLILEPGVWHLVSPPLDPKPGKREINSQFSGLGKYEQTWRAAKWDYAEDDYRYYNGPGSDFPELLPGRGFWIYHINDDTRSIRLDGTPVRPDGNYYELELVANSKNDITPYTTGNPYWYPIHWKNLLVRSPSTELNQVAKPVAISGEVEKWYVGIALEAQDGSSVDRFNRAGVITTSGIDSKSFCARDFYPPGSYVNLNLKNPLNLSQEKLAYDFRSAGQSEYTWELTLSTSYQSISTRLFLTNLANVPDDVTLTLKDSGTGKTYTISDDFSLPVTLSSGSARTYTLTAKSASQVVTGVEESMPRAVGITSVSPNPFNPSTSITFTLEREGNTSLRIYSANGQLTDTLLDSHLSAGAHTITWNAKAHASGVYLVSLESNGKLYTRKITLMK